MNKIKTKSEHIRIYARVPLYSKMGNRRRLAQTPKTYNFLYKIGLVLKWINFCTYQEERARDSEKAHKKVQKRKNSRKGVFGGVKESNGESIGRGLPSRI